MTTKQCRSCHQTKPVSEFYMATQRRDGLDCYCKPCRKEKVRLSQKYPPVGQVRHDRSKETATRLCSRCQQRRPRSSFHRSSSSSDGLHSWCKRCVKRYNDERNAAHTPASYLDYLAKNEARLRHNEYMRNYRKIRQHEKATYGRHLHRSERNLLTHLLDNGPSSLHDELTFAIAADLRFPASADQIPYPLLAALRP